MSCFIPHFAESTERFDSFKTYLGETNARLLAEQERPLPHVAALALVSGGGCSADSYWVQLGVNNATDVANTLVTASLLELLGF